jgi:hypothetical protein
MIFQDQLVYILFVLGNLSMLLQNSKSSLFVQITCRLFLNLEIDDTVALNHKAKSSIAT